MFCLLYGRWKQKVFLLSGVFFAGLYPFKMSADLDPTSYHEGEARSFFVAPFLDKTVKQAMEEVGCLPVIMSVSKAELEAIYADFIKCDDFDTICSTLKSWGEEFALSEAGALWGNYRFGIFNSSGPTHKKRRLITGINCKISREFYDWVKEFHGDDLHAMPAVDHLFYQLMMLEELCHKAFMEKIEEIAQEHPEVMKILYEYRGSQRLPITIRLIRFDKTGQFCLPLHYDISVMSLIFPSDDDPLEECLIIAPARGSDFDGSHFCRPRRLDLAASDRTCGLLISGTLLSYMGIPIHPTPHGVLPHDRDYRYVITACCHIPYLNTSDMNSVIDDEVKIPKQFLKKQISCSTGQFRLQK